MRFNQQQVALGNAPTGGSKSIRVPLDFTSAISIEFDFVIENENATFEGAQACYCDNAKNPNNLVVDLFATGQHVIWPAFSVGWLPVLQWGPMKAKASTGVVGVPYGASLFLHFVNVYMPPFIYGVAGA